MRPELFSTNIDGHDLALYGENDKPGRAPAVLMVIPGHDYEGGELELELSGEHIQELAEALAPPEPGWRPIEECGELEAGEYLVRMKEFITIARWSGAEWQVRIVDAERYYYRAEHITHVHEMGPIRGPGEG